MLDLAYRHARQRVTELVTELDDDQLSSRIPATPRWTAHDLLAHLVGGAADAASSRVDGAPGPAWTERHVAERRGTSPQALLREWEHVGATIETGLIGRRFTGPNIAADLICHEADLREAFGLGRVDRTHWHEPFLEVMMRLLNLRLRNTATVIVGDEHGQQWRCGSGEFATTVHADGYELLRAMFSRRSRRQIGAWNWASAPTPTLVDAFGFFGPRDDDQPIPGSHDPTLPGQSVR